MKGKILTREQVKELGLDKVSVITADMLKGYISIEENAFHDCSGLKSVSIPNSVTSIGSHVFLGCTSLKKIIVPKGTKQRFMQVLYMSLIVEE